MRIFFRCQASASFLCRFFASPSYLPPFNRFPNAFALGCLRPFASAARCFADIFRFAIFVTAFQPVTTFKSSVNVARLSPLGFLPSELSQSSEMIA